MTKAVTLATVLTASFFISIPQYHAFAPNTPLTRIQYSPTSTNFEQKTIYKRNLEIQADNTDDTTTTTNPNPLTAFLSFLPKFPSPTNNPPTPIESEEDRIIRLAAERVLELEERETERQLQVKEDAIPYLFLFALQFLPLLGTDRIEGLLYFFGMAVTTVYVGGRQVTLAESESVTLKSALVAPIFASFSIGVLYLLIKVGLDPGVLYAFLVTIFGALAISDIGVPILRNVLPAEFAETKVTVPDEIAELLKMEGERELPLDGLVTLVLGLGCTAAYWAPFPMEQKFILSNVIAWAIGMITLTSVSLGTFQTAAVLLAGLFLYDIFWVFGTEVMMTVATKVEAPVKLLYPAPPPPEGMAPRAYPFSLLGLGDVVIPGLFVAFMGTVEEALKPEKFGYYNVAVGAYAFGLAACFIVNDITHAGQPALLYLNPALIGSALACGAANGQLMDVWNFNENPEAAEGDIAAE